MQFHRGEPRACADMRGIVLQCVLEFDHRAATIIGGDQLVGFRDSCVGAVEDIAALRAEREATEEEQAADRPERHLRRSSESGKISCNSSSATADACVQSSPQAASTATMRDSFAPDKEVMP